MAKSRARRRETGIPEDSADPAPARIWIGGTGRSGTSLLYGLLGGHPRVHAYSSEMRFVIDPGGVFDLVRALSEDFSPARATAAWRSFRDLMLLKLDQPWTSPYKGFRFSRWLGPAYKDVVDRYLEQLLRGRYEGFDFQTKTPFHRHVAGYLGHGLGRRSLIPKRLEHALKDMEKIEQQAVRYFEDRTELIRLTGDFVNHLLMAQTRAAGKNTWCEKTPHNLLFADFLLELIPESIFIHVYRDPRGVAQSFVKQAWSSSDLVTSCRTVRDIWKHWFAMKERVDSSRLMEVRLETFARSPLESLNRVLEFAGLESVSAMSTEVTVHQVDYWKDKLGPEEWRVVDRELGDIAKRLGYEV